MTDEQVAQLRAIAVVYFVARGLAVWDVMTMPLVEMVAMYEYVSGRIIPRPRELA